MTLVRPGTALVAATAALLLVLTACGPDEAGSAGSASGTSSAAASPPAAEPGREPASDEPFGPGCSGVPASGEGSFAGMADDPVATAATNTPALSALAHAVNAADLLDSLNTLQDVTVLAPADPAFEAVPADALQALLADKARLTALLTHHLIEGRLAPDQLAGEHTTLGGDTVTVEGAGEAFTIAADQTVGGTSEAGVLCGNVRTANAVVYIIDQVLTPPAG